MVKHILPFLVILFIALSCLEEPDCIGLNNNYVGITFKDSAGNADTLAVGQLILIGKETSVLFLEEDTVTSAVVVLNYFEKESNFLLRVADKDYDLKMTYGSQAQFVSEDCGERYVLSKLEATSATIRQITVTSQTPGSNASSKNLEIVLE
jgi:hypothetical protein